MTEHEPVSLALQVSAGLELVGEQHSVFLPSPAGTKRHGGLIVGDSEAASLRIFRADLRTEQRRHFCLLAGADRRRRS